MHLSSLDYVVGVGGLQHAQRSTLLFFFGALCWKTSQIAKDFKGLEVGRQLRDISDNLRSVSEQSPKTGRTSLLSSERLGGEDTLSPPISAALLRHSAPLSAALRRFSAALRRSPPLSTALYRSLPLSIRRRRCALTGQVRALVLATGLPLALLVRVALPHLQAVPQHTRCARRRDSCAHDASPLPPRAPPKPRCSLPAPLPT